jgi:hypothetical protein
LKVAIGTAVPAIEAWYRCGIDPQVSEAAWSRGLQSGDFPFTKNRLKQMVYGTDRPGIAWETSRATAAAHRLLHDLPQLEALFPNGFSSLARALREWQ